MSLKQENAHLMIDHVFGDLMPLQGMPARPEQIALSHRMLDTMLNGEIALCDAGTGIGKTYAYLVAGIAFQRYRLQHRLVFRPLLISTSSIALQNAVLKEYIPFLSGLMLSDGMINQPIRAVIRKGKRHYACDWRLERRLKQVNLKRKNKAAANALASLLIDIDLDHAERLSGYDRECVCVPKNCDCKRKTCRYREFLQECDTRQYSFQICNHNLLLADAMRYEARAKLILPDSCAVILDEAHKLPETSRQMLGYTLAAKDIPELVKLLRECGHRTESDALKSLSRRLVDALKQEPEERPYSEYERMLIAPERVLRVIGNKLEQKLPRKVLRKLHDVNTAASALCSGNEDMVRYAVENEFGGTLLCATYADMDSRLRSMLWEQNRPFLLTSGTLAVGKDFRRFRQATGLSKGFRIKESVSLSPFDYRNHCLLYLPEQAALFGSADYYDSLADEIKKLLDASHGHALILFTSYTAMFAVKEKLVKAGTRWTLQSAARNEAYTLEQFKRSPGAVLMAAGAAWEGMDFPGDCVSLLIIPRLPFPQPNAVKEKERESFETLREFINSIAVPEMQIKLRQGFGRAIRTESDTCAIAILDDRAARTGRYHQAVLSALPEMMQTSVISDVRDFIHRVKSDQYFLEAGDSIHGTGRQC